MKNGERKEEKLLDELETMYQRVADSEKPAADRKQMEALKGYYEALQVSPDASLEKIKETYERLVDFWNPSQFADNPSLQREAEKKLPEITRAYEKILAFRQEQSRPASAEPPMEISEEPDLSAPVEETGHHFPRGKILLGGAALVVVVLAGLFWPTLYHALYHYDTIQSGNRTYQVRTNRITGGMTYLDGGKWNNPPIPVAKPSTPPALPAPPPPAQPPEQLAKEPIPVAKPSAAPALPAVAPPARPPEQSAKEPIPAPPTKPGPAEEPEVAMKKEAPSEKQASQPAKTKGYAIQVSAMRDLNLAREFVEIQKKSGQPVYLAKIRAKDREMWYRIYIGHFADEAEAARYMKEKKIKEFFPECFVQKLSR